MTGPKIKANSEIHVIAALLRNTGLQADVVSANVLVGLPAPHPLPDHTYSVVCLHPPDCACVSGQQAAP